MKLSEAFDGRCWRHRESRILVKIIAIVDGSVVYRCHGDAPRMESIKQFEFEPYKAVSGVDQMTNKL